MAKGDGLLRQRHSDIELLLLWEGRVGNSRLRDLYGLQIAGASVLLRSFREAFPDACNWDPVARAFEASPGLRPRASSGELDDYCRVIAHERGKDRPTGPALQVRTDLTVVNPAVFSTLHRACQDRTAVAIAYTSMADPKQRDRTVLPQVLVQVGYRWHLRAYCLKTNDYRGFVLGRIAAARATPVPPLLPQRGTDTGWATEVPLRLIPHPGLTSDQQEVVRAEYMGGAAARRLTVRACLLPYVVEDIHAALDLRTQLPPAYQLAVSNVAEITPWLFPSVSTA